MYTIMNTEKEKFESLWTDFITLVKGKLISAANKQALSTPLANLILSDAALSWNSDYEINGRWLNNMKEVEPQKAELLTEILLTDMKFSDVYIKSDLPGIYNYVIPAVGAGIGYAVSMTFNFGKITQVATTVIPAVLLFPAVKNFRNRMKESNKESSIRDYIMQLEKYKNSILSILS